jgi:hypothetical protein
MYVEQVREMKKEYKILVGKTEGKKPLRKFTPRWQDNIKMGVKEAKYYRILSKYFGVDYNYNYG